jgi:hypothetical protein
MNAAEILSAVRQAGAALRVEVELVRDRVVEAMADMIIEDWGRAAHEATQPKTRRLR